MVRTWTDDIRDSNKKIKDKCNIMKSIIQIFSNNSSFISSEFICPDNGMVAIDVMNSKIYWIFVWLIVFLSIEQSIHVFTLILDNFSKLTFHLQTNPYQFQTGLSLLWTLFTACSHILVSLTNRSNVAVLTKGFHIIIEAIFLIQIALVFGYLLFASIFSVVIFIIFSMILTLPCKATIFPASYTGLILDSLNFISHLIYGLSISFQPILCKVIVAFGFHFVYLILFTISENDTVNLSNEILGMLRIISAFCNYFAGEIFINICYNTYYKTSALWVTTAKWKTEHDVVSIWRNDHLYVLGETNNKKIDVFRPFKTGFDGFSLSLLNVYVPLFGSININNNKIIPSFLCSEMQERNMIRYKISDKIFVMNWYVYRTFYVSVAIILSIIFSMT